MALALMLLPWAALVLLRFHHHPDVIALVSVLAAVSVGLPVLWLTWAIYRGSREASSLAQIADRLAIAVQAQWEAEAARRRLNDPYPLAVSWAAADPTLTDTWDSLVRVASSGAGWPAPVDENAWAESATDLAWAGDLMTALARVPTGRLIVLGEPGAGKTMLMVQLVRDLLGRRDDGEPVPVLVSVASWNPEDQDLRAWLATRLMTDYPVLAEPPPAGLDQLTLADALLASRLILPLLDGLDEIPQAVRGRAISRISDALRPGERVVVTCRTDQYREAARPEDGVEATLRAAAIQLGPLNAPTVRAYLSDDAAGPLAKARWAAVFPVLGTDTPVGLALRTPLMVAMARAVYNRRPGEVTRAGRRPDGRYDSAPADQTEAGETEAIHYHPSELLDPVLFKEKEDVEAYLLDEYIWAAYRLPPGSSPASGNPRWSYEQAERWLLFLAQHQERRENGTPDIAWWKLQDAVPRYLAASVLVATLSVAAAIGYPFPGFGVGLMVGLGIGLAARAQSRQWENRLLPVLQSGIIRGLFGGLIGGALAGSIAMVSLHHLSRAYDLGAYLGGGLAMGIAAAVLGDLVGGFAAGLTGAVTWIFYENASVFSGFRAWVGGGSHLMNGAGIALAAILVVQLARYRLVPSHSLRWSLPWTACGLGCGLVISLITLVQLGRSTGLPIAIAAPLAGSLTGGVAGTVESKNTSAAPPLAVLRNDRSAFLRSWLAIGAALGVIAGSASSLSPGPSGRVNGLEFGAKVGLTNFIVPGLAFAFIQALWGAFAIARCWLALRGQLPWQLMKFLDDAHRRGVLRQTGAVYQFQHLKLQHRLANRQTIHHREESRHSDNHL